jgi:hypothetical protein
MTRRRIPEIEVLAERTKCAVVGATVAVRNCGGF